MGAERFPCQLETVFKKQNSFSHVFPESPCSRINMHKDLSHGSGASPLCQENRQSGIHEIPVAMNNHVSIQAHPRLLITTDIAALLLVELLLFAVSRIRVLISPLAFLLFSVGVLAGFAADVGLWFWKGIRAAEISDDLLTVYRGRSLLPETIRRSAIMAVRISRLPGSGRVRLMTMSGRRLRIVENAFPHEEFSRFLAALQEWAPHSRISGEG